MRHAPVGASHYITQAVTLRGTSYSLHNVAVKGGQWEVVSWKEAEKGEREGWERGSIRHFQLVAGIEKYRKHWYR